MKVKKIWSLNPSLYLDLDFKDALKDYQRYIGYVLDTAKYKSLKYEDVKTFKQWLKTEI